VDRRYSEFLRLYSALPKQCEGGPRLPAMPPKSALQKMFVPGFMRRRMGGLDAVLQAAVADDPLLTKHEALRKFLGKGTGQPSAGSKVPAGQVRARQEYDPCSPENVRPATDVEVADGEVRLLTQQLSRIEAMLSKRERADPDSPLVQDCRRRACELRRLVDAARGRRAALGPQEPAPAPVAAGHSRKASDASTGCPSDAPAVCCDM